jgi:hypothetical protein
MDPPKEHIKALEVGDAVLRYQRFQTLVNYLLHVQP